MENLQDYVKNNSKFLSIADGETVMLIYKGFKIIPDKFNEGKKTVSYQFQYPDTEKLVPWNKASSRIAMQFDKIQVGEMVRITRFGDGFETKYIIKPASKPLTGMSPKAVELDETEPAEEAPF